MFRPYLLGSLLCLLFFSNCRQEDTMITPPVSAGPFTKVQLIEDRVNGQDLLVVGEPVLKFYTAFNRPDNSSLQFHPVQDSLPVVLGDSRGNYYNIWGKIVVGPDKDVLQLEPANAMTAFWFAWGSFYPGCELYGEPGISAPDLPPGDGDWLIPFSKLAQGALPGTIPAIDEPHYIEHVTEYMDYLHDTTLCLVVNFNGKVFAYPHPVLEWHEVVNDVQGGIPFSLLFCPITGSGNAWIREPSNTFEVSGLLYNGNLILKERSSGSFWSQMRNEAVAGSQKGEVAETIQILEIPLSSVRRLFGSRVKLLSDKTPYDWDYGNFPCGDYCTNHDLILYSLFYDDLRVPRKERSFGVLVDGKAKVYRSSVFE